MTDSEYERFKDLTFEDFRRMARDPALTQYEKIGFPDSYRAGRERAIFEDIVRKLSNLNKKEQTILDVGPGCSDLPRMLMDLCTRQGHSLIQVDSKEMLDLLPSESFATKIIGRYPAECGRVFEEHAGKVDVLLAYSVVHYVFAEGNLFDFLDRSLGLLTEGGQMLIGDVPNISKRKRFFASPSGVRFHKEFTHTEENPDVRFNEVEPKRIDDAVVMSIVLRSRQAGFDAYILPQAADLPMANRREDILVCKP